MTTPKMESCRIQFLALNLAGLIAQAAHAEVIPGRWEPIAVRLATAILAVGVYTARAIGLVGLGRQTNLPELAPRCGQGDAAPA